jgi:hypothetical protein
LVAGGAPAAGRAIVFACNKGPRFAARVDDGGHFVLDAVPATQGLIALLGSSVADLQVKKNLTVAPHGTTAVAFGGATSVARISGRVTCAGQPLAGITVSAGARRDQQRITVSAADGTYGLELAPGSVRLQVMLGDPGVSDDFDVERTEPLAVTANTRLTFDFDLPRGCCRVRVLDDASGAPLAGVDVDARPGDGVQRDRFPGFRYRAGWCARTDARGEVLLRALPEGEPHTVRVGGRGFTTAKVDLRAPALDENVEPVVVRVARK